MERQVEEEVREKGGGDEEEVGKGQRRSGS